MQDIFASDVEPDIQSRAVQYLTDFSSTLNELEISFRDIEDSKEIIMGVLQAAGHFYNADRVYVLEMDLEMQIGVNTYEWCSDNAPVALAHGKTIPLELMPRLEQYLKMNKPLIISDVEKIKDRYPSEYKELMKQEIGSMLAAPYSKRINTGFIVVDNPRQYGIDPSMLLLMQYVIVLELNEIKQQQTLMKVSKRVSQQPAEDVHINMFGRFEVISARGILNDDDFNTEQGCNLLAYMVLNRKMGYSARMLCEALWPELDSDDPYNAVKSVVYRLRTLLSYIGLRDLVVASHGTFVLNSAYNIYTDVERLEAACKRIDASSKTESKRRMYQSIMELYKGNLLVGHDSFQWMLPKVTYYQNLYLQQLKKYMKLLSNLRDYAEIQRIATEALSIEMRDGEIHYMMILAIIEQGNRSIARTHFKQAEQYLSDEQKKNILERL